MNEIPYETQSAWNTIIPQAEIKYAIYRFLDFKTLIALRASNHRDRDCVNHWLAPSLMTQMINDSAEVSGQYQSFCYVSGLHEQFRRHNTSEAALLFMLGVVYRTQTIDHETLIWIKSGLDVLQQCPNNISLATIKILFNELQTPFELCLYQNAVTTDVQNKFGFISHQIDGRYTIEYRECFKVHYYNIRPKAVLTLAGKVESASIKEMCDSATRLPEEKVKIGRRGPVSASPASGQHCQVHNGLFEQTPVALKHPQTIVDQVGLNHEAETLTHIQKTVVDSPKYFTHLLGVLEKRAVFKLYQGNNLDVFFHKNKHRADHQLRARFIHHLSLALTILHKHNHLHGDIKASNVLVDLEDERPKLCDFELATQIDSPPKYPMYGAVKFQSPKILSVLSYEHLSSPPYPKRAHYTIKDEMYSFALLMFFIVANKEPYSELKIDSDADIPPLLEQIATHNKRPLLPYMVEQPLATLIQRGWSNDESERPEFTEIQEVTQASYQRAPN